MRAAIDLVLVTALVAVAVRSWLVWQDDVARERVADDDMWEFGRRLLQGGPRRT